MCGINGFYSTSLVENHIKRIDLMNKSIAHRGPDAEGMNVYNEKVVFGHRRLSIIDLDDRSNQPMVSNSGKTALVYNGEVFNYLELRSQLINEYDFKTNSDTEVLLAGYELKGLEWLLSNINGMFAFSLYDIENDRLYLIRDRFGIKPLFYSIIDGVLIFSSEIKGILSSGLLQPIFNDDAIDDYLAYRYVREPNTFFSNIKQVRSATYISFERGELLNEIKYWNLPRMNFDKEFDTTKVVEETYDQVRSAIKRWFIADVKVGSYLSGGVDSSLTTAILSEESDKRINTYTIGFKEKGFNEFEFARVVAEQYDTKHHEIILEDKDYLKSWEDLIHFKDAPLAVPNEIPLAIMSTELSKDITVVISGEGADELFGGYGQIFRSAFEFDNLYDRKSSNSFYPFFINKYEYVSRKLRDKFIISKNRYRYIFDDINNSEFENYPNEENIFRFFHEYHIKGLLNRVDMTTMQTSVEARPPFLDHKLIEYVYQKVPYELKLKWNDIDSLEKAKKISAKQFSEEYDIPKFILKEISRKYLTDSIIFRKKMGFPVPLNRWFPQIVEYGEDILKNADWIDSNSVVELIEALKNSDDPRSGQFLWMFVNIELFKKKYFNKNWKW